VYLLGGSILEGEPGADRLSNTSTFFAPSGQLTAVYRKIHLFDVKVSDREYLESANIAPGKDVVTAKAGAATLGFSVCYDVRFPELYRLLALRGAEILAVPAAFTLQTGKDHWEVLLRARAIETQTYVLAPAQWGRYGRGKYSYGHTLIADPWGHVIAKAQDKVGYIAARLDLEEVERVRARMPCAEHRVL
jgi:predicted amidohydrolase